MKKIVFQRADAKPGEEDVMTPNYRQRLVKSWGEVTFDEAIPLDAVSRKIAIDDRAITYAETEDEFLTRIAAKDMPAGASLLRVQ